MFRPSSSESGRPLTSTQRQQRSRLFRYATTLTALCALYWSQSASAVEKASEQVSSFYGSFSHAVPIEVPGFRGLEPNIALTYSSEGRNGFVGVGWGVSGFSTIQRANAGLGTPKFDAGDVFLLDGAELYPCQPGSVSPSCTSGGTHSTKHENYQRIQFDAGTSQWTVWDKDGTKTRFTPIITVPGNAIVAGGILRWGASDRIDTDGNTVSYAWSCQDGDCYPFAASYGGYQVVLFKEARPDWQSWAGATVLGEMRYRLRSIIVWAPASSAHIRGYKLSYASSPLTGRSLLSAVQQYGKDLIHDGAGLLTGGTTLPAHTFSYQNDSIGKSLVDWNSPLTRPTYVAAVTWSNHVNAATTGTGSSLLKTGGSASEWDAGADSTYAIASGNGYVEWLSSQPVTDGKAAGLSFGNSDATLSDIDYAWYEGDNNSLSAVENGAIKGTWTRAAGDSLRIEVANGSVLFKRNGTTMYQSSTAPTFPLRVDASLRGTASAVDTAIISGSLVHVNAWCQAVLYTGDFNGDGRTDQLCYTSIAGGSSSVSLSSEVGLRTPTQWLTGSLANPIFADFNNDGKTDLARHDAWTGEFFVATSTGSAFGPWTLWGNATGTAPNGTAAHCRVDPASVGSGDFNGDGLADVFCHFYNNDLQFIGLSTGTGFNFSVFSQYGCDPSGDEQQGPLDFDGDGKDDWYCIGSSTNNLLVFPSTGSAFLWPAHGTLGFCSGNQYVLGDINGDGRTDATCTGNGKVALSTGRGFIEVGTYGAWCGSGRVFATDLDGDAASELVCNNPGAGANDIQVRKWLGAGASLALSGAEVWRANWCNGDLIGGDFNGDGKADLYCKTAAAPAIAGTGGFRSDFVSTLTNGLGGAVVLSYTPSTMFQNTINPGAKYVVTSVSAQDGRGGNSTISHTYSGGLVDPIAREFLGFRYVRSTLPCLPGEIACPYVETWFRQDLASAGKVEKVLRRHGNGNVLSKQSYTYLANSSTLPRTSLLASATTHRYEQAGCANEGCAEERSATTSYTYDAYGNVTLVVAAGDASNATDDRSTATSYVYNPSLYIVDRASEIRNLDASQSVLAKTRQRYDLLPWGTAPVKGHLTEIDRWLEQESRWVTQSMRYSASGNLISSKDATNVETTHTYDAIYDLFPIASVNPAAPQESWQTQWDPLCVAPTQKIDANGRTTSYQTDALCRLSRIDYPAAGTPAVAGFELRHYRDFGNPAWQRVVIETPPAAPGSANVFVADHFDGLGRTIQTVASGPQPSVAIVQAKTYNARGLLSTSTAPYYSTDSAYTTSLTYDQLNRLIATTHPDGNLVRTRYGARSQTVVDENGLAIRIEFDAHGQQSANERTFNGSPVRTSYGYDALGRMTAMTDPLGIVWQWQFDSLGRMTSRADPASGTSTYRYDDAGRVTRKTDAKGQWTQHAYDAIGRLASKEVRNGSGAIAESMIYHYSESRPDYFNVGRLTSVDGPGTTQVQYDYDARGREVRVRRALDGIEYAMKRSFDASGRLTQLEYPGLDSIGPYQYDGAGRLRSIAGVLTDVTWDASGRPLNQSNANGTLTQRSYSPARGFLTALTTTSPSSVSPTLQQLNYALDPAGRVLSVTSPFVSESATYAYDELSRLISAAGSDTQTWTYDIGGRITNNSRIGAYSYNPNSYAVISAGANAYTYDANGNMLSGAGRTITWNARSLISQINSTQFSYDADGERLKKTTAGSISRYPLGSAYEVVNGVATRYVSAPGLGLIAKRVTNLGSTNTYWLHTDRLGSIQAVSDSTGTDQRRKKYRPYGEIISSVGFSPETRGWIGETEDAETGLNYLHARYYDPALGAFLSPDNLHPTARGVGPHRYGYGFGDPINHIDPTGRFSESCIVPTVAVKQDGVATFPMDCAAHGGAGAGGGRTGWAGVPRTDAGGYGNGNGGGRPNTDNQEPHGGYGGGPTSQTPAPQPAPTTTTDPTTEPTTDPNQGQNPAPPGRGIAIEIGEPSKTGGRIADGVSLVTTGIVYVVSGGGAGLVDVLTGGAIYHIVDWTARDIIATREGNWRAYYDPELAAREEHAERVNRELESNAEYQRYQRLR